MAIEVIGSDTPKATRPETGSESPLAKKVAKNWLAAKAFRSSSDVDWPTWERYYFGHHWNTPRAPWRSKPVVNFIFSTIETTIPIMTDNAPQVTVVPAEPGDTGIAEILGHATKRVWVDQDMDLKLPDILKTTLILGTGLAKVWWNPDLKDGLGDVAISAVDPRNFFPSPGATSMDDAEYVVFAANVPTGYAIRLYPEVEAFIKNGKITPGPWDEQLTINKPILSGAPGSANTVNTAIQTTDGTSISHFTEIPRRGVSVDRNELVTLVEYWDRNADGYPQVTVLVNGVVVKPTIRPFRHVMFPFIRFTDYPIPGQFWGMGDVQQLYKLQDFINDRRAQLHDIVRLTANPPFIADLNSGVNPKALTNRPGVIIYKNQGTEVHWGQTPQIPSALFTVQEMDKRDFDAISGIFDVTQGRRPVGVEAASAIVELQEAAQTRLRLKVRHMEAGLRRLGKQVIALIQQFYTEGRAVRCVGPSSTGPEFVQVNVPTPDGNGGVERLNDLSVGEYDLEIGAGSTMPVNKTRLFTQYLQMYRDGLVDQRAVLEHSTMTPEEVERTIGRMKQEQQQYLQMQMQMQAPDAGGAGTAVAEGGELEGEQSQLPTEDELQALEQDQAETQLGLE